MNKFLVSILVGVIIFVLLQNGLLDTINTIVTGTDQGVTVGKAAMNWMLPVIVVASGVVGGLVLWVKSKFG